MARLVSLTWQDRFSLILSIKDWLHKTSTRYTEGAEHPLPSIVKQHSEWFKYSYFCKEIMGRFCKSMNKDGIESITTFAVYVLEH